MGKRDPASIAAVERREAQRPTSLGARTPQAATPGNREIAVGARRAYVISPPKGAVAQRPGASRRSIPSHQRVRKRERVYPHPDEWAAQRWLGAKL